jgi:hypothetical protein
MTETGDSLAQESESFAGNFGRLEREARDVTARPGQTFDQAVPTGSFATAKTIGLSMSLALQRPPRPLMLQ